ncbi:L,D-transpeptidase family protein [Aureimonas fodinaquatilis]|uniref:L,D-transpeptidase family protein n=1 Tax=Aureimonas fodinaquatilis TaxID=2565783 RepID=A0A5B0DUQ5_9HYPH|nr:L,D-transpeptidase family protein [Aureimonas fodinaquatilis]KAA0969675.1 L,D-transpeptidase family protein [Aureimonas fodinaquatilis]
MQKRLNRPIIRVRRHPSRPYEGIVAAGALRLRCAIGKGGTSIFKREGDGATPVGSMPLLSAFRRKGRLTALRTGLPQRWARPTDGWCDAPEHPAYNRPVHLPFPASAETLQRSDRLYDFAVVLDYNLSSRRRGKGSAIFLHIARPQFPPTQGCVALYPQDMVRLAPFLRRGARLVVTR